MTTGDTPLLAYTPGALNISWPQGARLGIQITLPDDYPDDLTTPGTIVRSDWRSSAASPAPALALTTETPDGGITIRGEHVFTIEVDATTLATIGTAGADWIGVYDIDIVPGGDEANTYPLLSGTILLTAEVTRLAPE